MSFMNIWKINLQIKCQNHQHLYIPKTPYQIELHQNHGRYDNAISRHSPRGEYPQGNSRQ